MSSTAKHYDCLIIGSGQAGTPLATAFAKAGKRTALIERSHIGGCCVNEGCTPTKTMIASGRVAYLARRGQDYGVHFGENHDLNGEQAKKENKVVVDMEKVRDRKRKIVESFRGGNERRLRDAGVDVLLGEASFVERKTVKVKMTEDGSEQVVTADTICINTGERPIPPDEKSLPEIKDIPAELILNSTSVMELAKVPDHLMVIGGGYIGLEFGQLFRRLGAKVSIVQRSDRLMPREDRDITTSLLEIIKQDGISVHLNTTAKSASYSPSSCNITLILTAKDGSKVAPLTGSHILYAPGRTPNVEALNLSSAGIQTIGGGSKSFIACNDRLETNVPGIYVLGDVKGPPAFTHISYDDFRILQANLITNAGDDSKTPLTTKDRIVPYVAYTDPQLAHVGLHESEAREKFPGKKIKTAKMSMDYVARALETDETRGMMKAVVDGESGQILGFTCLGLEGGEVMSVVQMAMMGKVSYQVLKDAVWAHPSLAESLNNLWGFLE